MDMVAQLIGQFGFPIVVAMYVLMQLNKTVQANTAVMQQIAVKLGVGTDPAMSKGDKPNV